MQFTFWGQAPKCEFTFQCLSPKGEFLTAGVFEMKHKVKPGQHYRVRHYAVGMDKSYRHKLMAMGMIPGVEFEVLRVAPLGDPIQLSVHGYSLCLRSRDLGLLQLEEVVLA